MDINRSNYEIWLTDLLDGNLKEPEVDTLMAFLDANPDLKDDYEGLSPISNYTPSGKFPFKNLLKKSTSELSDSQFEQLCVAYLEKDLEEQQEEELGEIITNNAERRKEFQLVQKIVLLKPEYDYPEKKSLKKSSLVSNSIPLYISLLSAAAIIAFILYSDLLFQGNKKEIIVSLAEVSVDSFKISKGTVIHTDVSLIGNSETENRSSGNKNIENENNTPDLNENRKTNRDEIQKILLKDLRAKSDFYTIPDDLIANNPPGISPVTLKERSKIGSFLAREYRSIVLKEKKASDKPINGYEIAEGGIKGLNKLLGWEMALQKNSDENGNLKSVHFDSRFIKINTPVKKSKPQL